MDNSNNKKYMSAAIIVAVVLIGYFVLTRPDQRSAIQKIDDAVNELPNGVEKASRQLDSRTPGDKLKDVAKDTKEDIKKATNTQ